MCKTNMCASNTTSGGRCKLPARKGDKFCKRHSKGCTSVFELLKKLKEERKKGKYRVVTGKARKQLWKHYRSKVKMPPKDTKLYDKAENLVSNGYKRLVVGDHGAYVEFEKIQAGEFKTKKGEGWRKNNMYTKYLWNETNNKTKVYEQKGTVKYADYKIGMFYVAPSDLKL